MEARIVIKEQLLIENNSSVFGEVCLRVYILWKVFATEPDTLQWILLLKANINFPRLDF